MNALAYVLTFFGAYAIGFFIRVLWDKVKALENKIKADKKSKQIMDDLPTSTFIDEDDVVQRARFEQQEIERKLNPEKYSQMSDE